MKDTRSQVHLASGPGVCISANSLGRALFLLNTPGPLASVATLLGLSPPASPRAAGLSSASWPLRPGLLACSWPLVPGKKAGLGLCTWKLPPGDRSPAGNQCPVLQPEEVLEADVHQRSISPWRYR